MFNELGTTVNCLLIIAFVVIVIAVILRFLERLYNYLRQTDSKKKIYVLITGCDTGFGYGAALELNKRQIYVFAGCLTEDGVSHLNNDPNFHGLAIKLDVTKQSEIDIAKDVIEDIVKQDGLWCVVNNAGVLLPGPIEWQSVEDMKYLMNINLWGTVNVTKTMIPLIKKSRGRFVNVTSMAGRVLFVHGSAYSMSKFALEVFSDGLRYEMKPWGVSVHIVEPGMFKTNILNPRTLQEQWDKLWYQQPFHVKQAYGSGYFNRAKEMTEDLCNALASPDIQKVIDAICHAAVSPGPKSRYCVGYDANTLWMAIATFPTFIGDLIINNVAKLATPSLMKQ